MSRHGYCDDGEQWATIRWRGAVKSAIRGKRGQAFLKEMLAALDAMPEKRLVREALEEPVTGLPFAPKTGGVCAMGAVARMRGVDMSRVDPEDRDTVAELMEIPMTLACEIAYENDESFGYDRFHRAYLEETPERRWQRMRDWVARQIKAPRSVETGSDIKP